MAGGWTRDGAILDQIDDTITDGVLNARSRMPAGEGTTHCIECGDEIPAARRRALPGAAGCVARRRTGSARRSRRSGSG
ncbi:MAG: TraR/DksA C4-type zinc finger protein, partial [Brevundimonas sp.]